MPRSQVAHGTYRAYLRCRLRPEGACASCTAAKDARTAQSRSRERDLEQSPAPVGVLPSSPRERFSRCLTDLTEFVDDDYLYGIDDLMAEMVEILDEWKAAADPAELEPH